MNACGEVESADGADVKAEAKCKARLLLTCIPAILSAVGAIYLVVGFDSYALYVDANETTQTRLSLVKRTWWGFKKEEFALERQMTETGRRWVYYKPQPFSAAFDAHATEPTRFPLPYRVTVGWLHEEREDSN